METAPKPFEVVAQKFKISNESAKYFLLQVQKSFKTEKPPQHVIIDLFAVKKFKTLPRPYDVALALNEIGLWAHALHAAPPVPEDDDDGYFREKAPAAPRPRAALFRKMPRRKKESD